MEPLQELEARLREIVDLRSAAAVLEWDQNTYMPTEGAEARGRQIATLQRLAHEKLSDVRVGRLLEALEPWAAERAAGDTGACLVRMTRRDFDRATRVPPELTGRFADHVAHTWNAWTKARPADTSNRCGRCSRRRSSCRASWRAASRAPHISRIRSSIRWIPA